MSERDLHCSPVYSEHTVGKLSKYRVQQSLKICHPIYIALPSWGMKKFYFCPLPRCKQTLSPRSRRISPQSRLERAEARRERHIIRPGPRRAGWGGAWGVSQSRLGRMWCAGRPRPSASGCWAGARPAALHRVAYRPCGRRVGAALVRARRGATAVESLGRPAPRPVPRRGSGPPERLSAPVRVAADRRPRAPRSPGGGRPRAPGCPRSETGQGRDQRAGWALKAFIISHGSLGPGRGAAAR